MSSKIPVRDMPHHSQDQTPISECNRKSRKDNKMTTFTANFKSHIHADSSNRSKSLERNQKINEKNKELRHWINVKDNQIQELICKVTKLYEENEKLRRDKILLMDNYSSLMDKVDDIKKTENPLDDRNEALLKENEELKNDLKMLKILVFRLNKHLDYYQETINEKDLKFDPPSSTYSNEKEVTSTWAVNSHLLAPLMNSYEERIKEKNEIIKSYESELNHFTIKLKKILEENERVQEMYENLNRNSEFWLTEKQRLTSQCDILKNKAAIHAKRADLAKEKLMDVLKVYEQKIQSQSLDIQRLQEAYNRSKGEIATLKSYQKNPDAVKESVRECQKLLEELRQQFEVEKVKLIDEKNNLNSQLNQLREKNNELETLLEKQKLCNETLIEKNKLLKKSLYQERQSREAIEKDANQYREYGALSFNNLTELRNTIQEKEILIQNMRYTHEKEMEDMRFKLQQRDQTLKKILESKISGSTNLIN
ncbi:hypothetical protein PVAND_011297 [Polypedilum vanderplanki]|uniref:Uncharacterized protein n=1 Tax=Polypedilum vanderplanki TaxID=319348 RepID=A0A9J6CJI8_POLVA|nr:hypothetical protein PVAND_011297 [Polypedilum vanderplanki]